MSSDKSSTSNFPKILSCVIAQYTGSAWNHHHKDDIKKSILQKIRTILRFVVQFCVKCSILGGTELFA